MEKIDLAKGRRLNCNWSDPAGILLWTIYMHFNADLCMRNYIDESFIIFFSEGKIVIWESLLKDFIRENDIDHKHIIHGMPSIELTTGVPELDNHFWISEAKKPGITNKFIELAKSKWFVPKGEVISLVKTLK